MLVILGHPNSDSFCGSIAAAYESGAKSAGHNVTRLDLGQMNFDPVLHKGYVEIQELEPDLLKAQQLIKRADHIVFVFPVWWGGPPALMKGFIDRIFLPGFAFQFTSPKALWRDRLLQKRSARLVLTMDTPPWYFRWVYRMPVHNQFKRTILDFCGIKPVSITEFGPVKTSDHNTRLKWLDKVSTLGKRAM